MEVLLIVILFLTVAVVMLWMRISYLEDRVWKLETWVHGIEGRKADKGPDWTTEGEEWKRGVADDE